MVAAAAGQYESVLDVAPEYLAAACRQVFASKYTPRAILYRLRHGFDDADAHGRSGADYGAEQDQRGTVYG